MIGNIVTLTFDSSKYNVLNFNYTFERDTDIKGRPTSNYYGGNIYIVLESSSDNLFWEHFTFDVDRWGNIKCLSKGKIEVTDEDGICLRRIEFEAYISNYEEYCECSTGIPMLCRFKLVPLKLKIDNRIKIKRLIDAPIDNGNWQDDKERQVVPQAQPQPEEEKTLVRAIEGASEAVPKQKAEYKVTRYNVDKVSDSERNAVKWAVKYDDKQENLSVQGEKVKIEIKDEWAGKEITVMAYLNKPSDDVSQKTKVEKWILPRVLIETDRKEGVNADGSIARDMHFGLLTMNGLVPTYNHTNNFTLKQISNRIVRKALQEDMKENDDELFKRFHALISITSKGDLTANNHALVNAMRSKHIINVTSAKTISPDKYSNPILTTHVFAHPSTLNFVKVVSNFFSAELGKYEGNVNKVDLSTDKIKGNIRRPVFSTMGDRLGGLTIAINDTWGFRVTLTNYEYDSENKKYKANVTVRIFDHFGLDIDDILKFGTANLVREHLPYLVQLALEAGNMYAGAAMGSVDEYFETSAKGFRAWFILQHCRGYRPFVTVMEKPVVWEGVL